MNAQPIYKSLQILASIAQALVFALIATTVFPMGAYADSPISYQANYVEQVSPEEEPGHDCNATQQSLDAAEADCDAIANWSQQQYVCSSSCFWEQQNFKGLAPWTYAGGNPATEANPPVWHEEYGYCFERLGIDSCSQPGTQWYSDHWMLVTEECTDGGTLSTFLGDAFGDQYPDWCMIEYTGQDLPPFTPCIGGYSTDPQTGQCIPPADQNSGPPGPDNVGEPISAGSGNLYEAATDYKGGGPFPLVLKRAYNSGLANEGPSSDGVDQSLGSGWTNTFGAHLSVYVQGVQYSVCTDESTLNHQGQPDPYYGVQFVCPSTVGPVMGSATLWRSDGTREVFSGQLKLSGEPVSGLAPQPGSTGELLYSGGTYTYVRTDGYSEIYDSTGKLTAIKDPQGLQQTYAYYYVVINDSVCLQTLTITDPAGHQMVLNYDTTATDANFRRIISVTVPSNTASTGTATIAYSYDASGNLQTVTYPDSSFVTYEYNDPALPHALTGIKDENGNESAAWSFDDTTGKATCTELAPSANLPSTATTCTNDSAGIAKATIAYNADGSVDVTEATGLVRHLTFTTVNGRYVLATASQPCTACGNKIASITYDSNGDGYVSSTADFNGVVTNYTHDVEGHETSRVEAYGTSDERTTDATWNATVGLPEDIKIYQGSDTSGTLLKDTAYCYNLSGSICSDSSGAGSVRTVTVTDEVNTSIAPRTTTYNYNSQDFLTSVDGPRTDASDITSYGYSSGNLSLVTNALSQSVQFTSYTASGNPLTIADLNGVITTLTYDARGRVLTREVNDTSHITTYKYDLVGDLTRVTDAAGVYFIYGYDHAHRFFNVTDFYGDTITYTLDAYGNRIYQQIKDPSGNVTKTHQRIYNVLNELTQDIGGMGQTVTYSNFDGDGHPQTITDGNGNPTEQTFDHLGRQTSVTDANNGLTNYVYDSLDNLTYVTDPRQLTTHYQRDAFGEVLQLTSPDTGVTTYTYDNAGNMATRADAKATFDYTYDALNRLTVRTDPTNSAYDLCLQYDQGTDGKGHLTTAGKSTCSSMQNITAYTYDAWGNVGKKTEDVGGVTFGITYTHGVNGFLTAEGIMAGGQTSPTQQIQYQYDMTDRIDLVSTSYLSGSTWSSPLPVATEVTYEPFGSSTGLVYGNNLKETRTYDADYRITGISIPGVQGFGYTSYDGNNNIKTVTDSVDANGESFAQTLTYDNLNRIASTNGAYTFSYQFDADGNRTQRTNTTSGQVVAYNIDSASNKLETIYTNGALSYTYLYNNIGEVKNDSAYIWGYTDDGRLSSVSNASTNALIAIYGYDALGQRVIKTVGTTTTLFLYDEHGHVIAELDSSGNLVHTHVWLGDRPLAYYPNGAFSTAAKYVHTDNLGTPRLLTNASGVIGWMRVSDPYGNGPATVIASYGSDFNLFLPGMYGDNETGHIYNYYRQYNAATGRYYESDPIGLAGGDNMYVYALDNPISNSDPSGLDTLVMVGAGIGSNPFGHVAIAFTGQGTFSYGTKEPFGSSTTDYLANQASYRDTTTFWLPTTPQQEQEMISYIEANYAQPGQYSATTHNCSTMVIGALSAGGIGNDTLMQIESGGYIPPQLPSTAAIIAAEAPGAQVTNIPQGSSVPPVLGSFNP